MAKQSFLAKNAYLSVYVTEHFIYSHLAYSHYEINRSYILRDVSPLLRNFPIGEAYEYWSDFFSKLEERWNWQIFRKTDLPHHEIHRYIEDFKNESEGVSGCSVRLVKGHPFYKEILESLRKFSLDLKLMGVDKNSDRMLYESVASHLEYEDSIFLDLNAKNFKVYRFQLENNGKYKVSELVYDWDSMADFMEMIKGSKYDAFLSKYLNSNFKNNIWANFVQKPVLKSDSELLRDFIRAYITIQLLAIFNSESSVSKEFGIKKSNNLVWVSGELVQIPEFKRLLMSIIDGLHLEGQFDFCLDFDSLIYTFGKSFSRGVYSDEMVFTKDNFLPAFAKIFVPEIDLRPGDRKMLYSGRLRNVNEETGLQINAMSSEMTDVLISNPDDMILEGEFTKKAFLEGYEDFFDLRCFSEGATWNRVVFDGRFKPVVYGPGPRDNKLKFGVWLSSESY